MKRNLKMRLLKTFVLKEVFHTIFHAQELLNKMVLLKEKNHTLIEMARTMLNKYSLLSYF